MLDKREVQKRLNEKGLTLLSSFKSTQDLVLIQCFCGNKFRPRLNSLFSKNTSSCGCIKKNLLVKERHKNWRGVGDMSGFYFASMKCGAARRKLEFNITKEEIWELFLKQDRKCALSGIELSFNYSKGHNKEQTASLDRIDNKKGYTIDNVQWIHKDINQMKMEFEQSYFIDLCNKITENQCRSQK